MAQVDQCLKIEAQEISQSRREALKRAMSFRTADKMVTSYRENKASGQLWLPRGAWHLLPKDLEMRDRRSFPKMPKHEVTITLDYEDEDKKFVGQRECVNAMFNPANNQQGFIHRAPGTGKSNICLYFIAKVGTRSLVIVHTEDLLNQWVGYAKKVIPTMDIGIVRQGKAEIGQLTIAMLQTLYKRNFSEEWYRQFGCVINDEGMHAAATTFDDVLSRCTARYRFGVSASKERADGMHPLIGFIFGECIHDLDFNSPVPVTVKKLKSNFAGTALTGPVWARRRKWQGMINRLVTDPKRNKLIADQVNEQLSLGRSTLVLSRRIEHLQRIQELLDYDSEILAAKLTKKAERTRILDDFRSGKIKCVLATQLADEGLDVPILSCVALTFPAKHTDLILQQVGRALREYKTKDSAIIIDVVDRNVKHLNSQWHHRRRSYKKWGFKISGDGIGGRVVLPASVRSPQKAFRRVRKRVNPDQLTFLPD